MNIFVSFYLHLMRSRASLLFGTCGHWMMAFWCVLASHTTNDPEERDYAKL
jgi:hypothetical protein